ncbi:MAG: type IX secretion system plug protein domain-containing protein, partial [Bacteroidales bacterium]
MEFAAENVKSITFEKDGLRPAYPFMQPWNGEELTLHFDIIESPGGSLWYSLIHCDRDWNMSDLFTSDYLKGFDENQITDYLPSFNTRVNYTHYSLKLPNNDVSFLVSGNYIITVWNQGEPDAPLLRRRFFVSEGSSSAQVVFRRPMKPGTTETHQRAEITVSTGSLAVTDPYR